MTENDSKTLIEIRQNEIVNITNRLGSVRIKDLSNQYGVSDQTIRRDITALGKAGLLKPVRGGAVSLEKAAGKKVDRTARAREPLKVEDDQATSSRALAISQFIQSDQVIIIDGSYVALEIPHHVGYDFNAFIITNSPEIAIAFSKHKQVKVRVIGGRLRNGVLIPTSPDEVEFLQNTRADVCVLGPCALDHTAGIIVSDPEQAKVMSAMIAHAVNVLIPVLTNDLDRANGFIVGSLNKVTHLIVDDSVPEHTLERYAKMGVKVVRG